MARLDIRLDSELRRRLEIVVEEKGEPISEVVRRLIDDAYQEIMLARRLRAAETLASLEVEDLPDPEQLSRELEAKYEPGGLY